jgi:hypothetical protein
MTRDVQYWKDLLDENCSICRKFEFDQKEEIVQAFKSYQDTQQALKDARNRLAKASKSPAAEQDPIKEEIIGKEHEEVESTLAAIQVCRSILDDNKLKLCDYNEEALLKTAILRQSGVKNLADWCSKDPEYGPLIEQLLNDKGLMKEMLLHGGATENYGNAMRILTQLQPLPNDKFQEQHTKLAMAVALQHATPMIEFDSEITVDPVARFQHFAQAHRNGELDPAFCHLSAWEYRMIVDCNATNDQLQWGRDYLKRFRPGQVTMGDMKWRYSFSVKSDVGYRIPNWTSRPKTYQQLISGGGRCGPRAWFGRFIAKAHGTPTWGVRQPGHAAMGRWTPQGWETVLGGGWHKSYWEARSGLDFKMEAEARAFASLEDYYQKVILLECMAEAHEENAAQALRSGFCSDRFFWRSLVTCQRRTWSDACNEEPGKYFQRSGQGLVVTEIQKYQARKDNPEDDKTLEVSADGGVVIPSCAFHNKNQAAKPQKSFLGGGQIILDNDKAFVEYKLPESVPEKEYDLSCKVCNVHLQQQPLKVEVNGEKVGESEVPYTIGEWGMTKAIKVKLGAGSVLKLSREGNPCFGLAMKKILLTPC